MPNYDKMHLTSLVSVYDYVSVIDVNTKLKNSRAFNMLSVGWKTFTEDIPQSIIQYVYYFEYDRNFFVFLSATVSLCFALISAGYGAYLVWATSERKERLAKWLSKMTEKLTKKVSKSFRRDRPNREVTSFAFNLPKPTDISNVSAEPEVGNKNNID